MTPHIDVNDKQIRSGIRCGKIKLAGNKQLKIFGMLGCKSGKRMRKENRVFFRSEKEAKLNGFRPCGHCLQKEYSEWKLKGKVSLTDKNHT